MQVRKLPHSSNEAYSFFSDNRYGEDGSKRSGQFATRLCKFCAVRYISCKHCKIAASTEHTRPCCHVHKTIRPVLERLHWLPINHRVNYKGATLAYKVRSTNSQAYLLPAISNYVPTRQLRSSTHLLITKQPVRTTTARRAFSQAAPTVWNSLPLVIRIAETFERFRTAIRTHYYRLAFTNWSRDCPRARFVCYMST